MLPLTPPLTPFEPDPDAAELEFLSESTIPGAAEAEAVNARLTKLDRILAPGAATSDDISYSNIDDLTNIYSPLLSALESTTFSPPTKRRVNDLKVEVPLTPQNLSSSSPAKKVKRVTFPEMLHEYVPDAPILVDASQLERNSDESVAAFFDEFIEPMALEATRALEQEQLQEADSLSRVMIPVVDFTSPIPPWKMYGRKGNGKDIFGATELDLQRKLLRDVKRNGLKHFAIWSGGSKTERQLPWSPFPPELGKVELNEGIIGDDRAAQYLQGIMEFMSLEDVVISDALTWKPDGLRILDDLCESEDELEEVGIEEPEAVDMESLLRKRRRELEDEQPAEDQRPVQRPFEMPLRSHDGPIWKAGKHGFESVKASTDKFSAQLNTAIPRIEKLRAQGLGRFADLTHVEMPSIPPEHGKDAVQPSLNDTGLFGTTFSAASALSNFMQNMGRTSIRPETIVLKAAPAPKAPLPVPTTKMLSNPDSSLVPAQPFLFPPIPANTQPAFFIISVNLLQSQLSLVRSIGKLYTNANCVERDFATLPEAGEADILLSPATGLILSTIPKIKQKALPGQKTQFIGVRERLLKLSMKYERLIVLIGEGAAEGSAARVIDERDCEALAEFGGFAAGLDADVQVSFVPGGEGELVKWVVGCIVKYCLTSVRGENIVLLQDETLVSFSHYDLGYMR